MRIVEIETIGNNGHRNQTGNLKFVPEGWAVVPDDLATPGFPFGNIVVEEIDGVMTVTKWTECPCPEPEPLCETVISTDLSSYFAFCSCGTVKTSETMIDCAFGKNNEDRIFNLGLQLAMYSWYKGDSKTDYPFTELSKCCHLTDIENNNAAFKELWENNTLRVLYMRDNEFDTPFYPTYPNERVMSLMVNASKLNSQIEITSEDIDSGFVWLAIQGIASNGSNRSYYFNDVLVVEYTVNNPKAKGIAIKLSDYGIDSPGSYLFERRGTSSTYVDYAFYRKTTSE